MAKKARRFDKAELKRADPSYHDLLRAMGLQEQNVDCQRLNSYLDRALLPAVASPRILAEIEAELPPAARLRSGASASGQSRCDDYW
jgi:hypothetical protein